MSHEVKPITIKRLNNKLPVVLNKNIILKNGLLPRNMIGNVKVVKTFAVQEDVIYESKSGGFLPGDLREFVLVNKLNKLNNSCRTVAQCTSLSGITFEKTSDEVTKVIGQNNYDTLLSALCTVFNQDLKIRGIFSLLTVPNSNKQVSCQTEEEKYNLDGPSVKNKLNCRVEMQTQTEESYINMLKSKIRRRNKRKHVAPYVIRDNTEDKKPKKLIISPDNFSTLLKSTVDVKPKESQKEDTVWPDLGVKLFDEDSNNSIGRFSMISASTCPELMHDPLGMITNIDKVTRDETEQYKDTGYSIHDFDAAKIVYTNDKLPPLQPALSSMPQEQRIKMLMKQALDDYKNCLNWDESGHLPIHVAVLNNDMGLLKRQCLVFKMRDLSVDIPADNLTPLKMSLYQDNVQMTALLLQHNADVLDSDIHDKTYFHIAAEMATEHLQALVNHCQHNARQILEVYDELWKKEYANKTDAELAKILLRHINKLCDNQGYTPLMLASKLGRYENVKVLIDSAPDTVNTKMPSCGNTALYLAVGAACMDSAERGNKSKVVDHFRKTIEILVENGADPNLNNFAGSNVNDLLTEYNIGDLSMLIANKLTCRNFSDGKLPEAVKKFDAFMLVKDQSGNVNVKKIGNAPKPRAPKPVKSPKVTSKTTILQNLPITSSHNTTPQAVIIKSETITGQTYNRSPVNDKIKSEIMKNMSKVQSFQLNKPLILKSVPSNNKRKIEMTVEPSTKKTNTND